MGDRRRKDFITNALEDAGKAISGVVRDIGEIPVIKDIGKAINSEQIKKDFDTAGAAVGQVVGTVGNALKTTKERNKGVLDMGNTPVREDGPETDQVAPFIPQADQIYVKIIKSLYGTPGDIDTYQITKLGDQAVRAWVDPNTEHCIICIQGTSISTDKGLSNILDDVTLATQGGCNLAAVSTATLVLKDILARGFLLKFREMAPTVFLLRRSNHTLTCQIIIVCVNQVFQIRWGVVRPFQNFSVFSINRFPVITKL